MEDLKINITIYNCIGESSKKSKEESSKDCKEEKYGRNK